MYIRQARLIQPKELREYDLYDVYWYQGRKHHHVTHKYYYGEQYAADLTEREVLDFEDEAIPKENQYKSESFEDEHGKYTEFSYYLPPLSLVREITEDECFGRFDGKEIAFSRHWSGHTFSEEECQKLIDGDSLVVNGFSEKKQKTIHAIGRLAEQEYMGRKFWGFKALDWY